MQKAFYAFLFFISIIITNSYSQSNIRFSLPKDCTSDDYMKGRVIVKFKSDIIDREKNTEFLLLLSELKADSFFQKFPFSPIPEKPENEYGLPLVDISGIYEICFKPETSIEYLINRIIGSGLFEYAYPHYIEKLLYVPSDPNVVNQYYLAKIKAYQAWDICKSDTNRVIAITDTGIEFNHPDLAGAVKYNYDDPIDGIDNDNDGYIDNFRGWDLGSWDNNPQYGPIGHGIHVSGIAGAVTDNNFGMAGVGFKSKILPIKVDNQYGNLVATFESIIYAADHGANVINCSWGSTYSESLYGQDIVNYATYNRNALVVAACGNANNSSFYYPASYDNVLSVAGTDINDYKYSNSSYGYKVDISAPGTAIYSTWSGASFISSSGTSMASPVVAGAAALVSSWYPQYSMIQIAEILRNSADIIDTISANANYNKKLGKGRLNMYKALTEPTKPAVRLVKWSVTDSLDMVFNQGDTLYINAKVVNFLDTSSSMLYAKLECLIPEVQLIDSMWNIGVLNTMQSADNYSNAFKVKLLNVKPSTNVPFLIHFYDSSWSSYDYMNVNVNKDYNTLDTNKLSVTVTSHGNYAFNNLSNLSQGDGFRYSYGPNMVSGFGLMCGTDAFHVSDNLYSIVNPVDSDFVAKNFVYYLNPSPFGDQCLFSQYSDKGAKPLAQMHINIKQWTYAWDTPEDDSYFIVKYKITNDSNISLNNFHIGLFADWDIVNYAENRCWFDQNSDAILATHIDSSLFTAMALLSQYPSFHYALDMDGFNGSITVDDGFSKAEKFIILSNNRMFAGSDFRGNDIAACISSGPHSIAPNDTLEIDFVIAAGFNKEEIKNTLNRAREKYSGSNSGLNNDENEKILLFPNPANEKLYYQTNNDEDVFEIIISDMSGKLCYKIRQGDNQGFVDISFLPQGHYSITFLGKKHCRTMKFAVIR